LSEAVTLSQRALALDPQNVRALTTLASALIFRVINDWGDDRAGDVARAEKAIDAALVLEPHSSSVHLARSWLFSAEAQWGSVKAEAETAIAEDPNNANAYAQIGASKLFLGRLRGH
jgi:hypothetical protein